MAGPTLISFLGKSQLDSQHGYRPARYRFADGSERETPYFGLALAEQLGSERVVLLGTASSMWDLLVEGAVGDAVDEELRIALMDAVRGAQVGEALLGQMTPAMAQRIGRPVRALLIAMASDFAAQQGVLERLAEELQPGETVVIDVTHGFRHLAMLALAAARYLSHQRGIRLLGIYYGALDMTQQGSTPVVELSGLAHLHEWAEAFAAYEAGGDYGRFAPLLERDGFDAPLARALERSASLLALSNVPDAARELQAPLKRLSAAPLAGASEIFRARLVKALRWAAAAPLSEQQRLLALQALGRGDLLRAAVFGLESFLSRGVEAAGGNPLLHADKEAYDAQFKGELKQGQHVDWRRNAYWLLKNVRNACAHATVATFGPHAALLRNPSRLRDELEKTLQRIEQT
jgi:CRISPR-associated Csx2 family protein